MKITVFGKNCGSFVTDNGEAISYFKVSGVKSVDQLSDGVNKTVGYSCEKFKISDSAFADLPDDIESYEGGLPINADFDDKGKIVAVELA